MKKKFITIIMFLMVSILCFANVFSTKVNAAENNNSDKTGLGMSINAVKTEYIDV